MKMLIKTRFLTLTLLGVEVGVFAGVGQGAGYSVKGFVSETVYANNISVIQHQGRCPFELAVLGNAWRLTLNPPNGAIHDYASDGTNVVGIFHDSNPKAAKYPLPAVLTQGDLLCGAYFGNYVWLAYCSGRFLEERRDPPAPWLDPSTDPRAFMYKASVERFSQQPGLPARIAFVSSRQLAGAALRNPALTFEGFSEKELKERRLLTYQLQEGRQAEYQVLSTTNLAGLLVPTRFALRIYRKYGFELGTTAAGQPVDRGMLLAALRTNVLGTEILGVAEDIRISLSKPEWPGINGRVVSVIDRRFQYKPKDIDHITYNLTNQWAMSTSEPRIKQIFEAKKRSAHPEHEARFSRAIILTVFGFLAVLPAVAWWLARRRARLDSVKQ